jgi:hypothetical protein
MTHSGFRPGGDVALLEQLSDPGSPPYQLILHGHDRDEEGFSPTGEAALLVCTSFGARRERKTYVWLDGSRRYRLADLRDGHELKRLY